ncbi:MAG TPA: c-type cytochrome [Candidatus Limnocylindrales bacterium]|nr:c-type cytochrome [Candidatus Limnocylindrales bacterium]
MGTRMRLMVAAAALIVLGAGSAGAAGPLDHPGFTKTLTCTACHGAGGNSPSSTMPILAGMNAGYFKKQIQDYAAGKRPSPEMEPYAKQVLQLGVDDIAAFFAAQPWRPTPMVGEPAAIERGRAASTPCVVCHGRDGKGDAGKGIPTIAGQAPGYLVEQMALFKQDRRNPGDPTLQAVKALMKTIPDSSFPDLAAYYSSLR